LAWRSGDDPPCLSGSLYVHRRGVEPGGVCALRRRAYLDAPPAGLGHRVGRRGMPLPVGRRAGEALVRHERSSPQQHQPMLPTATLTVRRPETGPADAIVERSNDRPSPAVQPWYFANHRKCFRRPMISAVATESAFAVRYAALGSSQDVSHRTRQSGMVGRCPPSATLLDPRSKVVRRPSKQGPDDRRCILLSPGRQLCRPVHASPPTNHTKRASPRPSLLIFAAPPFRD
jgi:hypothetical protein